LKAGPLAVAVLLAGGFALSVRAEPLPKWEFGLGGTAFTLPDYRGSDERRGYVFPLPFLVYRGESVRVDRQGVRGIFFESDRVQLDFSLYGTPPVDSSKNQARQGMPDLDPTLEIGPLINVTLWRDRPAQEQLDLRLPMRYVIATDFSHAHGAGWVFNPHLALNLRPDVGGRWNLGLTTGPIFATSKFYGKLWIGGFARYDSLSGAVFEDSPLVRRNFSWMAGIAGAWIFAESDRKVDVFEPYY
jgi:outer membrane scaffolding protein for murein synthesis (MipA/OmpV family)